MGQILYVIDPASYRAAVAQATLAGAQAASLVAAEQPALRAAVERLQYERYLRREETNKLVFVMFVALR